MKKLITLLLGLLGLVFTYLVLAQGYALPQMDRWLDLTLRICAGLFLQFIAIQVFRKTLLKLLPILFTAVALVWGILLMITVPSWMQISLLRFLTHYAAPFASCAVVCIIWKVVPHLKNL